MPTMGNTGNVNVILDPTLWAESFTVLGKRSLVKMYFSWKKQKNALCPGTGQEYVLLPEPELVRSRDADDAMDTVCA